MFELGSLLSAGLSKITNIFKKEVQPNEIIEVIPVEVQPVEIVEVIPTEVELYIMKQKDLRLDRLNRLKDSK